MIDKDAIRELIKASFSGDRSAAGRYAAEQRWKGHVKGQTSIRRSLKQKLSDGPVLANGFDEAGFPKLLTNKECKEKFGETATMVKLYFAERGINLDIPFQEGTPHYFADTESDEFWGAVQAVDDVLNTLKIVDGKVNEAFLPRVILRGHLDGYDATIGGMYDPINNAVSVFTKVGDGFRGKEQSMPSITVANIMVNTESDKGQILQDWGKRLIYGATVHEFGHFLDAALEKKSVYWSEEQQLKTQQKRGNPKLDRFLDNTKGVNELKSPPNTGSDYSYMNIVEKFAESWSSWFLLSKTNDYRLESLRENFINRGQNDVVTAVSGLIKQATIVDNFADWNINHPVFVFARAGVVSDALEKVSFGGDRSEAGRYAANIRWQNRVDEAKDNPEQNERFQQEKIDGGPRLLLFGRDSENMPITGTPSELRKRYGMLKADRENYFGSKYGVKVILREENFGSLAEMAQLGALQAVEENLVNLKLTKKMLSEVSIGDPPPSAALGRWSGLFNFDTHKMQISSAQIESIVEERVKIRLAGDFDEYDSISERFAIAEPPDSEGDIYSDIALRSGYATTVHEFGHVVDSGGNKFMQASSDRNARTIDSSIAPSGYGAQSKYEKVAESYAQWWLFGGGANQKVLEILFSERENVVKAMNEPMNLLELPREHPVIVYIFAHANKIAAFDFAKASFGGDRSAAGRYAANMRWRDNQPLALHRQQLSKGSKSEQELSRLLREQSGRATEQDAFMLKDYSQYGHKTVNYDLRGTLIADLGKPVVVRGVEFEGGNIQTRQTLEAFDRVSTPTATDMTVYRGMKVNLDKEFRVGERFMDRGFSSTSSEMLLTQPFGKPDIYNQGVIMEISVPKGTRVVANDNFAMRGDPKKEDFYYEKEIILGPQTKFEVVSVAKVDQKVIAGSGKFSVTIVKVEVVQ